MNAWFVRWRLALRIARRDALRHRGRTALVLAMVGLPVLAVVGADTFFRTANVSQVERMESELGAADARIIGESRERIYVDPVSGSTWHTGAPVEADPPWTAAEVAAALPDGSRVVETTEGRLTYRTRAGRADVPALVREWDDPMLEGTFTLDEGRFPADDGEVAISRVIAERGYAVGDTLELTRDEVPARVVGVVRPPAASDEALLALPPSAEALVYNARPVYLATVPGGLDWPAVQDLNSQGLSVVSREVAVDPPAPAEWLPPEDSDAFGGSDPAGTAVLALVVASVVLEIVLLAGPAFAVGVRRQRRDLALIGAAGGSAADLRRVVLASGVVLGGGAALLGAVSGVLLARLSVPVAEDVLGSTFGPFEVPLFDVAVTAAVGILAGLGAAWFPARQAARTDVVDTLAGRRGQVRTTWRSPVLGLVLAAAGMALVVAGARGNEFGVAAGAVLLVLGLVTASPWLVGLLAPLAPRLPVAGRLAVRDATRNRSRTAPALAAVMATVAGVTALAIGSQSDSTQAQRDYQPTAPLGTAVVHGSPDELDEAAWADIEAALRAQAPERPVHRLRAVPWEEGLMRELVILRPGCTGELDECRWFPDEPVTISGGYAETVVLGADAAASLTGGDAQADVARLLSSGRVVVIGSSAIDEDGAIRLAAVEYGDPSATGGMAVTVTGTVTLPAATVPRRGGGPLALPAMVLVPEEFAERLPVDVRTTTLVTGGPEDPVTPAQEEELRELLNEMSGVAGLTVERGWTDELAIARYVLFGLGALLVLIATLTATGLALTDARPDFATLAAVGAAPRTRRRMAMASAAVVGGGGALLGLVVGMAPGIAVAYPLTSTDFGDGARPLVDIPWLLLGGVAVLVPLLAVAVTGLAVRSRLPMVARTT